MTTPLDQQGMRERHQDISEWSGRCRCCVAQAPCDAIQALDALKEAQIARDEARSDWVALVDEQAALEADLAAMWSSLERAKVALWNGTEFAANDCYTILVEALAASPGAELGSTIDVPKTVTQTTEAMPGGWLATAREVVEALAPLGARPCEVYSEPRALCSTDNRDCINTGRVETRDGCPPCTARALLARPEVKAWAGR